MNHSQCHGPFLPVVQDTPVMRSPGSSNSPGEASTFRHGVITSFGTSDPSQISPVSPVQQHSTLSPDVGSSRLKRRASQGSLLTKPSPVSRFLSRSNASLHTPSFDHLGTKGRIESRSKSDNSLTLSTPSSTASSSLATRAFNSKSAEWDPAAKCEYLSGLPPTPPEEDDHIAWNPRSGMLLFDNHLNRGPGAIPMDDGSNMEHSSGASAGLNSPSDQEVSPSSSTSGGSPGSSGEMECDHGSWLENSIEASVSSLPFSNARGESVKIVCQMLPYPRAADKTASIPTNDDVFCGLVQAVQHRLQHGQSPYINVTHAVPEQFSLSNLPHSPPLTPRSLFPGDDYFNNSTVFYNAAVVSAYHDFRGPIQGKAPLAPMPIVPPSTVHISILERYLPPSSAQEHKDLFKFDRPSFLKDRLFELSPDGGSLLFVYPTRRGGQTFKSQYLGPILDPLLRQLVVVNGLSSDIGRYLGKLNSVNHMDDFDSMRESLNQLCNAMSSSSSQFSIADARKGSHHLDRNVWTEWFIHQERARMKEVLSVYWQNGRRSLALKPASTYMMEDKEVTSAMLLGEILEGIRKRPYGDDMGRRQEGIELGVFVIRRTH